MVSVTVLVVVVFDVIEPCVKFGTTGTAFTDDAVPNNSIVIIAPFILI